MGCCPHCAEILRRLEAVEAAVGLDVGFLRVLLPALAAAFGSQPFTIAEARRHAAVRAVLGERSSTAVGKLFARAVAAGLLVDGYELEQLGRHGSRALWRVWRRAG